MKDIQGELCAWLENATSVACYRDYPVGEPDEFITAPRRGGGFSEGGVDEAMFVIAARAKSPTRAREIMYEVIDAVRGMIAHRYVFNIDVQSVYEENDSTTGQFCWKATVVLTCE